MEIEVSDLHVADINDVIKCGKQLVVAFLDVAVIGGALFFREVVGHQLRESHDGVERRADFVSHVLNEHGLDAVGNRCLVECFLELVGSSSLFGCLVMLPSEEEGYAQCQCQQCEGDDE